MSQPVGALVAGSVVTVGSHLVGLDLPISLALGAAAVGVGIGVQNFLNVTPPEPIKKAKKVSKKERERAQRAEHAKVQAAQQAARAAAASAPKSREVKPEEDDSAQLSKAAKKRAKQKEKKAAASKEKKKKDAKKAVAAEQAEEQAKIDAKAKRKQEKALKKQMKAMVAQGGWEEVSTKKGKKVVEEEDDDDESKTPKHEIHLTVEPRNYGKIIGNQGATLQSLTSNTKTQIDVPKKGTNRNYITISGDPAACEEAKKAILQLCNKGYSDVTHAGHVDEGIEVPPRSMGAVIGPGGSNIKAIQAKTNTRINMPEKGGDSNTVSIVGDAAGVAAAQEAIRQLVKEGYSSLTHENYVKQEIEIPREMLRLLIGPSGSTIRSLQSSTNTRINVPPRDGDDEFVMVTIVGEIEAITDCRKQLQVLLKPAEPVPTPAEWRQENTLAVDPWDED